MWNSAPTSSLPAFWNQPRGWPLTAPAGYLVGEWSPRMPQYPGQPSSSDYTIHEDMLCAGDLITGKAICRGDSGGPLVCPLNGTWFLMGLSSWSLDCCSPIGPSVFTRLTDFTNWINQKKTEGPPPEPALAPPQETPPALDSMTSQGTVHKPGLCAALLAAHTFLLLLILLGSL
ncbi:serine protease 40-like isoform X3 [Pongo pygmaeus]|uniref:serine protease 40-like isoform X3 n=1 Tax=Pongo pygmaeus TaxID=9600 RepID=UPI0023E31E6E|nr:serine protease 40-like isoform X3 [Pongo pygmaeus]